MMVRLKLNDETRGNVISWNELWALTLCDMKLSLNLINGSWCWMKGCEVEPEWGPAGLRSSEGLRGWGRVRGCRAEVKRGAAGLRLNAGLWSWSWNMCFQWITFERLQFSSPSHAPVLKFACSVCVFSLAFSVKLCTLTFLILWYGSYCGRRMMLMGLARDLDLLTLTFSLWSQLRKPSGFVAMHT